MALPTLLQRSQQAEKETFDLMKEQRDSLKKIFNRLKDNNEGNEMLRKDVQDLKKEFIIGMKSFSDLKSYLGNMKKEDKVSKTASGDRAREQNDNNYKRQIVKFLSRSPNRQSENREYPDTLNTLLEKTILIKEFAEKNYKSIELISKSFQPKEKERDRKLLAEEIGKNIDSGGGGGGILAAIVKGFGSIAGGIVSGLGGLIGGSISGLSSLLGAGIVSLSTILGGLGSSIVAALGVLGATLLGGLSSVITEAIKSLTQLLIAKRLLPGSSGPIPIPGTPDAGKSDDKTKRPQDKKGSSIRDMLKKGAARLGGMASRIAPFTGPGLIAGGLASVFAGLGYLLTAEETQYGNADPESFDGFNVKDILSPQSSSSKVEPESKKEPTVVPPTVSETEKSNLSENQKNMLRGPDQSDAETARLNRSLPIQEKLKAAEESNSIKDIAKNIMGDTSSIVEKFSSKIDEVTKSISGMNGSIGEITDTIKGQVVDAYKGSIDFLNNMELKLGKDYKGDDAVLKLFPGLGDAFDETLNQVREGYESVKETLVSDSRTDAPQKNTVNSVSTNVSQTTALGVPTASPYDMNPTVALLRGYSPLRTISN
jgi:hypothetical protein